MVGSVLRLSLFITALFAYVVCSAGLQGFLNLNGGVARALESKTCITVKQKRAAIRDAISSLEFQAHKEVFGRPKQYQIFLNAITKQSRRLKAAQEEALLFCEDVRRRSQMPADSAALDVSGNLLINPGFESGNQGWRIPLTARLAALPVHSGISALEVRSSPNKAQEVFQDFRALGGQTYYISLWINSSSLSSFSLSVKWFNAAVSERSSGNRQLVGVSMLTQNSTLSNSAWKLYEGTVLAPPETVQGRLDLLVSRSSVSGTLYADDGNISRDGPGLVPTPTVTVTPTSASSVTPTTSPTATIGNTLSPTATRTITHTATRTTSHTATSTRTPTPLVTGTPTQIATATIANSPTASVTRTATALITATLSRTATSTATGIVTFTRTPTHTSTHTPTVLVSATPTPTAASTPTNISTLTRTPTRTGTSTPTVLITATVTQTATSTPTSIGTFTRTPTRTPSRTPTPTATAGGIGSLAMNTALRTRGVAPLAVFFDAVSPATNVIQPAGGDLSLQHYVWDFADYGSGSWNTTGKPKNVGLGYVTAHVFETPGSYAVGLTVTDSNGVNHSYQQTIVVDDPNTIYEGNRTRCLSSSGTFSGCPIGAEQVTTSDLRSQLLGWLFGTNGPRRLLLARGDSWTLSSPSSVSARSGPYTLGAYGVGGNPVVTSLIPRTNPDNSPTAISLSADTTDLRILDIDFISNEENIFLTPGTETLLLRSRVRNFSNGISTSGGFGLKARNFVVDSVIEESFRYGIYYDYGMHVAFLGNVIDDVTGGPIYDQSGNYIRDENGEHLIRCYNTHSLIGHNIFRGGYTNKHQLKFKGYNPTGDPARDPGNPTETVEYSIISDNVFEDPDSGVDWVLGIGPVDASKDQRVTNSIVERNIFEAGNAGTQVFVMLWARSMTVRNNIFDGSFGAPGVTAVRVTQRGIEPPPLDNRIYNNSAYRSDAGSLTIVDINASASNTTVRNNLVSGSNATSVSNNGSGSVLSNNIVVPASSFRNAAAGDFSLLASSAAIDAAISLPAVREDLYLRPRNDGPPEIGAIEYRPSGETSRVGVNLEVLSSSESGIAFVDVMKHSAGGGYHPWNAWPAGDPDAPLDSLGYPLEVVAPQVVSTTILNIPGGGYPTGNYSLIFDGSGVVSLSAGGNTATFTSSVNLNNTFTFNIPSSDSAGIRLSISRSQLGNNIRNIRLIMPGHFATYQTLPFYPALLERLKGVGVIRMMEWLRTNNQRLGQWSERTLPQHVTQTRSLGVAYEHMIDLCNSTSADLWFNIPHRADDNYVSQLASLIYTRLNPERRVYIEYSNELWNRGWNDPVYSQDDYVINQGVALGLDANATLAGYKYTAKRSAELFRIFENQFGVNSPRLVKVIPGQAGNNEGSQGVARTILNAFALSSINAVPVNPWGVEASALAGAPYFGNGLADSIASQASTISAAQILDMVEATYLPNSILRMQSDRRVANEYGLALISYEGGQSIRANTETNQENATLTQKLIEANRHVRMYDIYRKYLNAWFVANGAAVFTHFTHVGIPNEYGSWGALESLNQPLNAPHAPKYRALMDTMMVLDAE